MSPSPDLVIESVSVQFGELKALDDVTLRVLPGEIFGLIGPNGSGKTTLVNVVTGFQRPRSGRVVLGGEDITRVKPEARASVGLARTFQAVRLFNRMTVRENVEVGALAVGVGRREARRRTDAQLELLELRDVAEIPAQTLPYGHERRVAIARAMATHPRFLLLDEPAAGLDEDETDELSAVLQSIKSESGCGLLVIEHDMRLITGICDRAHVLASGCTLAAGTPAEVVADPHVIEAYLGKGATRVTP